MIQKKEQWEQEKLRQKTEEKEFLEEQAKQRKREEDEYSYNLKISRQKEQDEYQNKKTSLEKKLIVRKVEFEQEVASRMSELKKAEAELAELRKNNDEYPEKLKLALDNKESEVAKQYQTKYEFEIKLIEKQNETDIRLKDQLIVSLQDKIKELQSQHRKSKQG